MPRRVFAFLLLFVSAALAAAPEVLKVEPPNWWTGHSINPVRLLIRGRNLAGARAEAMKPGTKTGLTSVNDAGTYAFVDVVIEPAAAPGAYPIRLTTPGGAAEAPFVISEPLPRAGRFQGFSSDDVIYLLMPDRFANADPSNDDPAVSRGLFDRTKSRYYHGGDIQGVINRLPYLKDLGVTALWLNPIYDNANGLNQRERYESRAIIDYHGYGAVDFYGVEEHFGDLGKYRELVDKAHAAGIKVIQDQVANHTGPYHPWVKDSPTPTWFNGTEARHLANTWQIWTLMDPHATPETRKATLEGWFINILPDLNQDDDETARYLVQNTLWWIGVSGIDGIRQDTLPYVPRRFWRDWMAAIKREYPNFRVVGEMWDGDPALVAFFQGGRAQYDGIDSGVDALFDFPLHFPLRRVFTQGGPLREAAVMMGHDHLYRDPNLLVTFLGSHDVPRFMNEKGADITGLKLATTFLMTARGIPMIYYGDEIGLPGGADPDNRRDFPGGWPEDARNAFEAGGRTPEQQSVFEHVRRVTRMRAEMEALRRGDTFNLAVSDRTWAFARTTGRAIAIVVFNNGAQPATVECPVSGLGVADGAVLKDWLEAASQARVEAGRLRVEMPARSAAVFPVK